MYTLGKIAKAIVAALAAAAATLVAVTADGVVSTSDAITVVLSVLGAFGVTWAVPNNPPSR